MIVWLNVPYVQKDEAKRLGARWSAAERKWYVQDAENLAPFLRWIDDRLKQPTKSRPNQPPSPGGQAGKKAERRGRIRAGKQRQAEANRQNNARAAAGVRITGKHYRDDGVQRDWAPWEDGPDAVACEFSEAAIGEVLRSL